MVCDFRAQLANFNLTSVTVGGVNVPVQINPVRICGVMFDSGMTMSAQFAILIISTNHLLTNTSRALNMLSNEVAKL